MHGLRLVLQLSTALSKHTDSQRDSQGRSQPALAWSSELLAPGELLLADKADLELPSPPEQALVYIRVVARTFLARSVHACLLACTWHVAKTCITGAICRQDWPLAYTGAKRCRELYYLLCEVCHMGSCEADMGRLSGHCKAAVHLIIDTFDVSAHVRVQHRCDCPCRSMLHAQLRHVTDHGPPASARDKLQALWFCLCALRAPAFPLSVAQKHSCSSRPGDAWTGQAVPSSMRAGQEGPKHAAPAMTLPESCDQAPQSPSQVPVLPAAASFAW